MVKRLPVTVDFNSRYVIGFVDLPLELEILLGKDLMRFEISGRILQYHVDGEGKQIIDEFEPLEVSLISVPSKEEDHARQKSDYSSGLDPSPQASG